MPEIKFIISQTNLQRVIDAVLFRWPKEDDNMTDAQWAKEAMRRNWIKIIHHHETQIAMDNALSSISIPEDIIG